MNPANIETMHGMNDIMNMLRGFKDEPGKECEATSSDHTARRHQRVFMNEISIAEHTINTFNIKFVVSGNTISIHDRMKYASIHILRDISPCATLVQSTSEQVGPNHCQFLFQLNFGVFQDWGNGANA